MSRRGPFTRDRDVKPHSVSEIRAHIRAHAREDNWTVPVRTDTGHNGHTLKGCVCPVRSVRSHGLAGHHRTLSAVSSLSGLSGERDISAHSAVHDVKAQRLSGPVSGLARPAVFVTVAIAAMAIDFIQLFKVHGARYPAWERHGKIAGAGCSAALAATRKRPGAVGAAPDNRSLADNSTTSSAVAPLPRIFVCAIGCVAARCSPRHPQSEQ